MIKIFDSMSKTKKELVENNAIKNVNLYLCGPTVYNYIHVGNIRPVLVVDVLHRLLLHKKYKVDYVHNITDIDDKIINQSIKEQISEKEISEKYYQEYLLDLKKLNVLLPTQMPKVTDFISENINFIQELVSKKYAYVVDGDVYFQVDRISTYGSLSNKKLSELISNVRIANKENKKSTVDFALWKSTAQGINWDSIWAKGRPGWHTECVVFIKNIFNGETINFHGGGVDLIFPHHENERAQFLAATNKEIANIWWHNGHINLDSKKMSKSLNNVVLVKNFCKQYHPFVLRYLILNHDHQQPINFTDDLIVEAVSVIKKYQAILQLWSYYSFVSSVSSSSLYDENYYQLIIKYLSDNINTTNVFTVISDMIKDLNQGISKKDFSSTYQNIFKTLVFSFDILGFNFIFGNYSQEVKDKIKAWQKAKEEKNFVTADLIRKKLQDLGILPKN